VLELLKKELLGRFKARGESLPLVTHNIGYELRSADPTPHDMAYCRALGFHSIRLFVKLDTRSAGVMVAMVNGNLTAIDFNDIIDPETNRTKTRQVDLRSDEYAVARAYQIRLERSDLENPIMLARLAVAARLTPQEFHDRYLRAATRLSDMKPDAADATRRPAPQPA